MMIASAAEKLKNPFLKYKNRVLSVALILAALTISRHIYRIEALRLGALNAKKEAELKKNEVLNEISQSEKKLQYYKELLKRQDASLVINLVGKIAKDSNVRIISIKPNTQESHPSYVKYPFALTFSADSYHSVGKFINKIENYPDLYSFDALNLKLQEKERVLGEAQVDLPKAGNELIVDLTLNVIAFEG